MLKYHELFITILINRARYLIIKFTIEIQKIYKN
jgi:hypothetical protein